MRKLRAVGIALGVIGVFVLLGPFTGEVRGDWIQLRSGVQIHGKILRQDEDEITLQLERGGVSSFPLKSVQSVHRTEPETRKKLPLGAPAEGSENLPEGIHPRPDALRSTRRPVPGGTLLLPEEAVREPEEKSPGDSAPTAGIGGGVIAPEAVYRLGESECRVKVGHEPAVAGESDQTERLRERIRALPGVTLHVLEVHRIAGLTTWIAEWSREATPGRLRTVCGWILSSKDTLEVVEVVLPETAFLANPYRYRVIPRTFRPEEERSGAPHPAGAVRPASP